MAFQARILGPVEASLDGRVVSLGSPKQRAVFALLVLNAGRVVTTDRLVDELWGEDPPESPASSLQVYISRLRRSLGAVNAGSGSSAGTSSPSEPVRLLRRGAGYQLDVAREAVDAHRFADLVMSGRALVEDRPTEAQEVLEQALTLPRGPALADVIDSLGASGAAEAKRLDDLQLLAQQSRLAALLARGDAATAAADAAALVREHPWQEDLRAALMLSLYRAGRQGEALRMYDAAREELADELGIDPGPGLRTLHAQILGQDPALDLLPVSRFAPEPRRDAPDGSPPDREPTVASRARGIAAGTVPEPLTSLVGREAEVDEIVTLLATSRLTALVGTGGAGKTRLALAVAERLSADLSDGVWWVDVAALDDPAAVPRIVAAAVGSHERAGQPFLETAIGQLGDRHGLLLLDSCEHLVEACADVVHRLLVGCPRLRVLVTTREPLAVPGELVWPVHPLDLPPVAPSTRFVDVARSPAVRLWCQRAASALRGFELDETNAGTVSRICHRLDGLPLAIELAAARLRVLSLEEIAETLDDHLEVLVSSDRGVTARHRTLRATLDWSFRLLAEEEQRLLAELSVFHGSFTLEAAMAVRSGPAGRQPTLEVVSALIDRSLVTVADRGRPTRYRLLETIRVFAHEHLVELGGAREVEDRHLAYFLDLAEAAEPRLTGPTQQQWLNVLDGEVANLIAALQWSIDAGTSPQSGLRLVSALWRFWYLRGRYAAGRAWLDAALSSAVAAPAGDRAKALASAGRFAYLQCDYAVAAQRLDAALDCYLKLGDASGTAAVLQSLGCVARERGRYTQSRVLHEDSRQRWRSLDRPDEVARSSNYLGFVAWLEGDGTRALEECEAAMEFFSLADEPEGRSWSLIVKGGVAAYAGDVANACELLEESRRESERAGYAEGVAWSLDLLGLVATRSDDPETAGSLIRESLRGHWRLGDRWRTASVLEGLAGVEARVGDPAWAGHLLGGAETLRSRLGAPLPPVERPAVEALSRRLTTELGGDRLAAAVAAGRRTPLEETVHRALARVR